MCRLNSLVVVSPLIFCLFFKTQILSCEILVGQNKYIIFLAFSIQNNTFLHKNAAALELNLKLYNKTLHFIGLTLTCFEQLLNSSFCLFPQVYILTSCFVDHFIILLF